MRGALFLPSANWYCSQLCAWGVPLDMPSSVFFAYGCKSHVAIYEMDKTDENSLGEPRVHADLPRGKHDKRVTSVIFLYGLGGELLLACAGEEGSIQIWNVAAREMVERHKKHKTEVMALAAASDNTLVAGDRNGVLSVWQRDTGVTTLATPIAGDCIYTLAVSPGAEPKVIAIGYRSGKVVIWDPLEGAIRYRLKGTSVLVHAVSWTDTSGKLLLATSSRDKRLRVWDEETIVMESQLPKPKKALSAHQMGRLWLTHVWVPAASSDGLRLLSSSFSGDVYSWEWSLTKKRPKLSVAPTLLKPGHSRPVFNLACLTMSDASAYVGTISMDRDVRVTHLPSMACHSKLAGLGGHVYALARSASGALAAGVGDNTIRVVADVAQPQTTSDLLWKGLQSKVTALAWHPLSDTTVAYGCEDGAVGYYNTVSHQHVRFKVQHHAMVHQVAWRVPPAAEVAANWLTALEAIEQGERDLVDDAPLTAATPALQLWSTAGDGSLVVANPEKPDAATTAVNKLWGVAHVTSFGWRPDVPDVCAVGTKEGIVHIVADGAKVHQLMQHTKAVSQVVWRETRLTTASTDGIVCEYDCRMGGYPSTPTRVFRGHSGGVTSVAWSPSGSLLATASVDGTVQVWPASGDRGYNYRDHTGRVLAVAWIDDDTVVSGGEDQSIRAWAFAEQEHTTPPKPKNDLVPAPTPTAKKAVAKAGKQTAEAQPLLPAAPLDLPLVLSLLDADACADLLASTSDAFVADGDWERAARLLLMQGRVAEALRLVAKEGKLSATWLAYAPMAGVDVWKELTRLYAKQLLDCREYQDAALHYTTIGDVHGAIASLADGLFWREALALLRVRCSPRDPVLTSTLRALAAHLERTNQLEAAGHVFAHLRETDAALASFLKVDSAAAFDAAVRLPLPDAVLLDLAGRAMARRFDSAVAVICSKLDDPAAKLFLELYLASHAAAPTPLTSRAETQKETCEALVARLAESAPTSWPLLLTELVETHARTWFWPAMTTPTIAPLLVELDEDAFSEATKTTFAAYLQVAPVDGVVLEHLGRVALDVAQGCLLSAFESWSAGLEHVMKTTEGPELLTTLSLVFPAGVGLEPAAVGELATEDQAARELWAQFFLFQCIALARALRLRADSDPAATQGALLHLIQWLNRELPPATLQSLGADVTQLTHTASNELSLLYHQLLDARPNDTEYDDDADEADDGTNLANDGADQAIDEAD
ncbi:hypothetical protein ACHHYP_15019 [Achlya hypogyna]|uniref:Gem-associated protein 5 TPR domain-containing protein n=1 Tax=Achlya hypogyna TaxID=1202772 RepID=A0A1V9YBS1_ACHHY|nr:hypothetical protein ACHHYP_15019 [Achlya hypogyna]